ncbi:hypothetical protein [Pelagibacterium sp. H642]|uniref:hypothetical protein n=1 Tax=Pelagibacterium sp. H642 TaxID=1881069 RepID=UPI0028165FE8|nr:hypothetical protein [Pelagibacterium sp. H642]WMT92648.1 hypothetical protein NO934_20105 [Pelagibacterium sp. H642]
MQNPIENALGEIGQSIVAILSNIESRRAEMLQIQEALEGSVSADDIIQTLPPPPIPRNRAASSPRPCSSVLGSGS